ncbi:hypothetical protein MKZ38_004159 [Zalerion maritima]|uniref:Uncharacterized protein n=1 Tax=Zalerion maritima TaxID=339359 RepID=A0AAD5RLZ3_9PEZI|nr:hypothetical protein MKZ38_004159 [Zalerion maritima]
MKTAPRPCERRGIKREHKGSFPPSKHRASQTRDRPYSEKIGNDPVSLTEFDTYPVDLSRPQTRDSNGRNPGGSTNWENPSPEGKDEGETHRCVDLGRKVWNVKEGHFDIINAIEAVWLRDEVLKRILVNPALSFTNEWDRQRWDSGVKVQRAMKKKLVDDGNWRKKQARLPAVRNRGLAAAGLKVIGEEQIRDRSDEESEGEDKDEEMGEDKLRRTVTRNLDIRIGWDMLQHDMAHPLKLDMRKLPHVKQLFLDLRLANKDVFPSEIVVGVPQVRPEQDYDGIRFDSDPVAAMVVVDLILDLLTRQNRRETLSLIYVRGLGSGMPRYEMGQLGARGERIDPEVIED